MINSLLSLIAMTTTVVNAAFVPTSRAPAFSARHHPTVRESAVQPLNLFDYSTTSDNVLATANNMWLATIDADIAAIPDNEFAPIFMGGIVSCIYSRPRCCCCCCCCSGF
jgi:hypothetical protein